MAGKFDDDEYVANLLKQDAKDATKKYELVGIDAFNPKRLKSGAPKPNTGFLRHLIRQTDSHNAALLAKEAEESNARLKRMNREKDKERRNEEDRKQKKAEGRLTPVLSDDEARHRPSKRRNDYSEDENRRDRRQTKRDRDNPKDVRSRRHRDRSEEVRRHKRRHMDSDEERSDQKRRRHRHSSEEEHERSHTREHRDRKYRRHRSYSKSTSRSRSRSPRSERDTRRRRHRDRSHSPRRHRHQHQDRSRSPRPTPRTSKSNRLSPDPASDSDPLVALVGPLPPPTLPPIRARGRGAHKANGTGIESRFSSTYDPTIDVRPHSDDDDNWGDALEAFRDRQRWKQQGADRLKAAGFTDAQVKKWEKGDVQNEEDVVWSRRGQAREWDRGKVVDGEGDVDLKADFGRLR